MLLSNVGIHLLVVPAGILFLSFSKWYVICDAANSSIGLGIFLGYFNRHTHWSRLNATRPIKFDLPRADVLLSLLDGISRIPTRASSNAKLGNERQCENTQDFYFR